MGTFVSIRAPAPGCICLGKKESAGAKSPALNLGLNGPTKVAQQSVRAVTTKVCEWVPLEGPATLFRYDRTL